MQPSQLCTRGYRGVCVCVCVYSHLLPRMHETMRQSSNPCKYMRYMYMGFVIHGKGQVISRGRGSSGGLCLVGGVCALAVVFPLGGVQDLSFLSICYFVD